MQGQALAQTALLMVSLMVFAAVAVDGGILYSTRRQMQNAADAGAFAGARAICFFEPGAASSRAQEYAVTRNGADTADVEVGTWTVQVVAKKNARLFFAAVIGRSEAEVSAIAKATCGAANGGCGLWPIAFELGRWTELQNAPCGTPFIVWNGDAPNQQPDCNLTKCDCFPDKAPFDSYKCGSEDGDGINDVVGGEARTWLDFSGVMDANYPYNCTQGGCGTMELSCWLQKGSGKVSLPACITGDHGNRTATQNDVNSRIGDTVALPIYDYKNCAFPPGSCPGTPYHVVKLGCVRVIGFFQNYELPALHGGGQWKGNVIVVKTDCSGCATNCAGTIGTEGGFGDFRAVSLTN
jgi:hypothetical protein